MSSRANNYFGTTPGGPILRDFQHAARLFTDADQRLAPKTKYLYHVNFRINTQALTSLDFKYKYQTEINMLVKTAELPKFQINTETLNQYNRKKNVQNKVEYQPVQIKFHDDNLGVTRQLWENYFSYYYGDPTAARNSSAYNRSAMQNSNFIRSRYGLDNDSSIPFFRDITIYQMGKRSWNGYTLVNPMISTWNHDSLDYSSSMPGEQTMTVIYEAVAYSSGSVIPGATPSGFSQEHYDRTPSPIALAGGAAAIPRSSGFSTLSSVLSGAEAVFGAIGSGQAFSNPANAIATAITAVNTYQNARALGSRAAGQELGNLVLGAAPVLARAGGVQDVKFSVANTSNTTNATPRNINR